MPPPDRQAQVHLPSIRRIDHAEAERLTGRLASSLRDKLGAELRAASFVAIPRGGLFALGMLSYLLDLPRERVGSVPSEEADSLIVLVDDCALSGARVATALSRTPAERVVFAHLLSPPSLRRAVEAEPRVIGCFAGGDLGEGEIPEHEIEQRWRERLPGRRYWLGAVEPVAFPWSEPETVWWNARDGRLEDGWRRAEPRRCLRFRAELGLPPESAEDDPDRPAPFGLAPGVLWKLERGDDGAVRRLLLRGGAEDRLYGFEGTALEVWRALLAGGDSAAAAERLAALYEVGEGEARADVDALIDELLGRGLLARCRPGASDS